MNCWAIVWKSDERVVSDPGNGQYYLFDSEWEAIKALKNEENDGETRYEVRFVNVVAMAI